MNKKFQKLISLLLAGVLVFGIIPPIMVGADSALEIFNADKVLVSEKQYLTEYRSAQLYAMVPVTAEDGTVTGTEIDLTAGGEIKWESNLPLLANVDSEGKVTAYDYSKRAVIELWINENIRVIPLTGDAIADSVWNALDSTGTDLDDMNTDAIVLIVTTIAGETLGESLRKALDNMNVEITATYYDAEGKIIGSDTVEFVIEKSLVANVAPTGVHITNKSTVPTTVAVGSTVQLRGFCTPTRLNQGVKFWIGSNMFENDSKNYASVTEDGLVTFLAPGQATVRVNPENALYGTFSDTITFTILDPADLPVESFDIVGSTSVGEGKTIELSIDNVVPAGAYYGDLTWKSDDSTIAVIDENGVLTGLDGGSGLTYSREVVITANAGGVSKDITVKVTRPVINTISSVEISGNDSLAIGTSGVYTATVKPDRINDSSSVKREWGVIDPLTNLPIFATAEVPATDGAVTVDVNGNVTAIGAGVAQIYCKASLNDTSVEDRKSVVCGNAITDFEITGTNAIKEGEKTSLSITVLAPEDYEKALLDTIVWSISDESVASISETGVVLARDAGGKRESKTVTVTATVSGVSRTFNITISGNGLLSTDKLTDGSVEGLDCVIVDLPRKFEMHSYPARVEGKATYWAVSPDEGGEPWSVSDSYDGSGRIQENTFAKVSESTENEVVYGVLSGKAAGSTKIHAYRKNSALLGIGKSYVEAHKDISIVEIEPNSITLKTPDKLEYLEGDTELDLTGMEVYLNYDRARVADYYPDAASYTDEQLSAKVTDYVVGDFNPEALDVTQYVIVSITRAGKTFNAVIPIVIKSKILTQLNVTPPEKMAYIEGATELDLTGFKATADYENYNTEEVSAEIDYSSFSMELLGVEQQVRVYYEHAGRTAEAYFPITVYEKPVVQVQVNGTIGKWTDKDVEFNLSYDNPLTNIKYYWRYENSSSFYEIGNKLVISSNGYKDVQFRVQISGTAYGKSFTVNGDWSEPYDVKIDKVQLNFSLMPEINDYTNNGYKVSITNFTCGISGIEYIKYNGKPAEESFREFTVSENGTYTVEIKNNVGDIESRTIVIDNIDKLAPRITDVELIQIPENAPSNRFDEKIGTYYSGDVIGIVNAEDEGVSGIEDVYYRYVAEDYTPISEWEPTYGSYETYCDSQFKGYLEFKVIDNAGNESNSMYSNGFVRDSQKPIITNVNAICNGEKYVADTWADDIIEFTPEATAYSGIYEYYYNINGGRWIKLSKETLLARDDGAFTYNFKAVSCSGLESDIYSFVAKIDRTVPVVRIAVDGTVGMWTNKNVTFNLSTFNDCPSGKTFYYNDGSGWKKLDGDSLVIDYSSNAVYSFKAINGAGLSSVPSDEYNVMVDNVKPSAQVIYGVTEKTDSPYDIAIVPQMGESGYLQIYFNGADITDTLKYTVTQNGSYALTVIGNNMLSSTMMIEVDNFSALPSMNFETEKSSASECMLKEYKGEASNITIPLSIDCLWVCTLSENAFSNNAKIQSVNIPNTVKIINDSFNNCPNLTEVVIPSSVTQISETAFSGSENVVIYCNSGSYAEKYARDNGIVYELLDLREVGKTSVNSRTEYIFTEEIFAEDVSRFVAADEGNLISVPAYSTGNQNLYGTGSLIYHFKNGSIINTYTVIVCGDLNGDSVVDGLDTAIAKRAQRNPDELEGCYLLAADFDNNGSVEDSDYKEILNILFR